MLSWMGHEARQWVRQKTAVVRPPAFPRQVFPSSDVVQLAQAEYATSLGECDDGLSMYSLRTHTTVGSVPSQPHPRGSFRRTKVNFLLDDSDVADPNMVVITGEVPGDGPVLVHLDGGFDTTAFASQMAPRASDDRYLCC